jgi:hypothetical protein
MKAIAAVLLLLPLLGAPRSEAQWAKVPDAAVPRMADGSPNLNGRTPKARGGKPDLSGVWLPDVDPLPPDIQTVEGDQPFPRHMINIAADLQEADVALQPWAAQLFQERLNSPGGNGPSALCKPSGVPAVNAFPLPYKIVQTPQLILMLYEVDTVFRQIFLDGRKPVEDAVPRWMGYSTGTWEGDTLVVDTVGFHDAHWLDALGHPHSDELHLIERFRRPDVGHLEIEITIDDPRAYTKPLVYTLKATLTADDDLLEFFCTDNEKDVQHYQ